MAIGAGTAMLIGGGLNYLNGLNSQNASHKAIGNAIGTLEGTSDYSEQMKSQGEQILDAMLKSNQAIYGNPQDAAKALQAAQAGINDVNPYSAGEFDYTKEIADFYDPAFQLSVNTANDAINESQALGGNLFSSDTANKIAAQNQTLATQMYREALNAMNADKSLEQGIWQGNEAAKQAAASSAANLAEAKYGMANESASNLANSQDAYYNALLGLNDDYFANKADYAAQIAAMQAQDPGKVDGILGLGGFLGFL